ncbi:uncharacterized mitochondrial protein-like protein [Tanacetum coccineum]|uniref:Uncharacterized mitochondrial protein-like protein n=1 Tax=Tanacetum coccineum TaxID=301880 RepID=A0ABQ4X3P9_9ASTR
MTGNIAYLSDFKQFDGGYVAFGGVHMWQISGKGTLKTTNLDFEDDYFFADENQILLKVPRKDNMYSFDMKNIVPKESLTCLVAKCYLDESKHLAHKTCVKLFRVYNTRTKRVEENLHIGFLENKPMIEGTSPKWLFDIDTLTQSMNYIPVSACTVSNISASTSEENSQECIVMPIWKDTSYFDSPTKNVDNGEPKTTDDAQKQDEDGLNNENAEQERFSDDSSSKDVNAVGQQVYVDDIIFGLTNKELCTCFEKLMKDKFQVSSMGELTFFLGLQVQQKEDGIFIIPDKFVAEFEEIQYSNVKSCLTPVDLKNPLVQKYGSCDDVDILKANHLGLGYSRDSHFLELVAYYWIVTMLEVNSDRKSTTGGCQVLGTENYYCQANVNVVQRSWAPKLQLFSNSYQLRHCLRGGISQEVGTPRYPSLVVPLAKVGDEAVHKELGDRMERAATTASSLEAEHDSGSGPRCQDTILGDVNAQTRFEITSIPSNDPQASGEDSMKLTDLMVLCTKLQTQVLDLQKAKDAQAKEITALKKRI